MALKWAHNYVDFWAVLVANNLYTNPSIYFLHDYLSICLSDIHNYQHFLQFPQCFQKILLLVLESLDYVVKS